MFGAAVLLLFSLGTLHPPITGDVWSAELGAWRLATAGTPWLDDVTPDRLPRSWHQVDDVGSGALWTTVNPENGHRVVARSPGPILAAVPAYAVAGWLGHGSTGPLSELPGSVTAALLAAVAAVLLLAAALRLAPPPVAWTTATVTVAATPMWSVAGNDLWPHSVGVLGVAGMAWAAGRERWWLVGVLGGVALTGRLHLALVVAVVGVGVALARRRPAIALRVAGGSLPFVALSSAWGHWLYGTWSPTTGYATSTLGAWPDSRSWPDRAGDLAGVLVSPGVGVLVWTPCLLALLPALPGAWRQAPDWVRALALGGVGYLLAQVYLNPFHGGSGFWGYRLPLETLTACFPLLVLAAARLGRHARAVAVALAGAQAGMMLIGVLFGRAATNDDPPWRGSALLDAFQENPVGFVVIVALTSATALLLGLRGGGGPPVPVIASHERP